MPLIMFISCIGSTGKIIATQLEIPTIDRDTSANASRTTTLTSEVDKPGQFVFNAEEGGMYTGRTPYYM